MGIRNEQELHKTIVDLIPKLIRYSLKYFTKGDRDRAEDLVHDVIVSFLSWYKKTQDLPDSVEAYLKRSIKNKHLSNIKKKDNQTVELEEETIKVESSQQDPFLVDALIKCLSKLSEEHREVTIAVCQLGYTYEETASKYSLNPKTVATRLHKARKKLHKCLSEVRRDYPRKQRKAGIIA